MSIWDWIFDFYLIAAIILGSWWFWKTEIKSPRKFESKPCYCDHPIKCDTYDKCMKNK